MPTIRDLIEALMNPSHSLHKKILKHIEELIAQTREDTATEMITALESDEVTVNCSCGCWENLKAKFMKPKETQSEVADIPGGKLRKGQVVTIYEDPLTLTKPEGKAQLISPIDQSVPDAMERWLVQFLDDDFHNPVERMIKLKGEV
jgi:hypothetical protein